MNAGVTMPARGMETHRQALFGLCYRMTGSAADAEDLVQETFRRALERPPKDTAAPLRPWLFRVATNLCIDTLRRRKREGYFGPWLPSPVEIERLVAGLEPGPEARYDVVESATSAFLLALEALDPRQRAALVLRDVLGLTSEETAAALETSPGNVRVLLHRARKQLEAVEPRRAPVTPERKEKSARLLRELVTRLALGDREGVVRLLADDVESITDGGGEFVASVRVNRGVEDVVRLMLNIAALEPLPAWLAELELNGLPAMAIRFPDRDPVSYATKGVFWIELDPAGEKIARLRAVNASAKLAAIRFG